MEDFQGNFNKYASTFKLAQVHSGINNDSILVDTLQQGVPNQLAIMMTAAALPLGQERLDGDGNNGSTRQGNFTRTSYGSRRSEEGMTILCLGIPHLLGNPLAERKASLTQMPWMSTGLASHLTKEGILPKKTDALLAMR